MSSKTERKAKPFHTLSTSQRFNVRCLRVVHFLMARSGLFQAFFLLCLMGEQAVEEKVPPIHPRIVYVHAFLLLLTSTGLSFRIFSRPAMYLYAASQLHMAYLFMMTPALKYPTWLRVRTSLRSVAVAGASLRVTSVGSFDSSSLVDKIACGLIGSVSGLLGIISMPMDFVDKNMHLHEQRSIVYIFDHSLVHWLFGALFFAAFLLYTFPVLAILPSPSALKGPQGTAGQLLSKMTELGDTVSIVSWILMLAFKDLNWHYWQPTVAQKWFQMRIICDDVIVIASLFIGSNLTWLSEVTDKKHASSEPSADQKKKMN